MRLTRRQTIAGLGLAFCAVKTPPVEARFAVSRIGRLPQKPPACAPFDQSAEGPFYIDQAFDRTNISEGRPGLALALRLRIVAADTCAPLEGARVDVWHADATGCYSGFQGQGDERTVSTVGETFLRGTQRTDSDGRVGFLSTYPGWYAGRTAHIHFKVFVGKRLRGVGQIYFPDDLNRFVFTTVAPYSTRSRRRDTLNRDDFVLASSGHGREFFADVHMADDHMVAALTISVES
jgi:protocatechuate 3,4-dioxygenase beta subunit